MTKFPITWDNAVPAGGEGENQNQNQGGEEGAGVEEGEDGGPGAMHVDS